MIKIHWQHKLERKLDRDQRIINLHKHVLEIRRLESTALIYMANWLNAEEQSKKEKYKSHFEATLNLSKESIRYVRDNLIYYPDNIKSAVETFFADYQKFTSEICGEPIHNDRLLEITDSVNSSLDNIIEMIEKRRSKLID